METKDLQQICAELTARIDEKYEIDRDPQLAFAQLIEEIGELAVDINRPALRNQALDEESLKQDFREEMALYFKRRWHRQDVHLTPLPFLTTHYRREQLFADQPISTKQEPYHWRQ